MQYPVKEGNMKKIFCLGFPKCGTTSLTTSLDAIGYTSFHEHDGDNNFLNNNGLPNNKKKSLQDIFNRAERENTFLLNGCEPYNAFTQMEWSGPDTTSNCFPQIKYLYRIVAENPDAIFIYQRRPFTDWVDSVCKQGPGKKCQMFDTWQKWGYEKSTKAWQDVYEGHYNTCKKLLSNSHNFYICDITRSKQESEIDFRILFKNPNFKLYHENKTSIRQGA